MVRKLLVDTCVWLDLARDYRQEPVISALEDLIRAHDTELIVHQIVIDELESNKIRVIEETRRSLRSHFRVVREAVNRFGDDASKPETLKGLTEIDHKMAIWSDAVTESMDRIDALLKSATAIPTSAKVKQRVTDRAITNTAPYHRDRNSAGDAILIEIYAEQLSAVSGDPVEFAFITHNTKDFSAPNGNRRAPHPDLDDLFDGSQSTFWISLICYIKSRDPDLLANHEFEFSHTQQSRSLSEILEAEHLLFRQIWYNRHRNLRTSIEEGKHHVASEEHYSRSPYRQHQTLDSVWSQALDAAKRTEEEVDLKNLGPWDDFEWAMTGICWTHNVFRLL